MPRYYIIKGESNVLPLEMCGKYDRTNCSPISEQEVIESEYLSTGIRTTKVNNNVFNKVHTKRLPESKSFDIVTKHPRGTVISRFENMGT